RVRFREDLCAAGLELNLVQDHDVAALDQDATLVRAAVLVVLTVVGLGLVRALVGGIRDLVPVVVGIRTAVLIVPVVLVFRIQRALVLGVEDAVLVIVRVRAAVRVLESIA